MTSRGYSLAFPAGAALVVGGTGAIGQAVVSAFAEAGCDVAFTYRRENPRAKAIAAIVEGAGQQALPLVHDLRCHETAVGLVGAAVEGLGPIHAIVYAAGPDISTDYVSLTALAEWMETIDTDVNGFFSLVRAAIPHLRQSGGAITAVTTTATRRYPGKDVLSAVPKAAVESLIRAVALEEGRFGIRANAVAPGWVDAGLGARIVVNEHMGQSNVLATRILLRRFGAVEEIAAAVMFLSSLQAGYVTGQVMAVDGGWQI